MIRSPIVLTAAVALALGGTAAVAGASPSPPPCAYTLSPPQVVQLSGTNVGDRDVLTRPAVTGRSPTSQWPACSYRAATVLDNAPRGKGLLPAQVFYQPYRPGATYIATGRGCATTGNPPQPVCQPMGPLTATL